MFLFLCGDAGAVKRTWLRTMWLSAYEGSIPSPRISREDKKLIGPFGFNIASFLHSEIKNF